MASVPELFVTETVEIHGHPTAVHAISKHQDLILNTTNEYRQDDDNKICVVMVGLPARGKSLIAGKALRYLSWIGIPAKIFNVGQYRRQDTPQPAASFFDNSNPDGERLRRAAAEAAVTDMVNWFRTTDGQVAILDATNSTKKRREWIYNTCRLAGIAPLFVESKCDDHDLIMNNIREVKTTSPDYVGQDPEEAAKDFMTRIRNYEKVYETLDKDEDLYPYVKLINVSTQVIINRIQDYLSSRLVYYIQNLHIRPRSIWLSRHGESEFNLTGRIGGDANISPRGEQYALALPELLRKSGIPTGAKLTIWTSTLKRTHQTVRHLIKEMGYHKLEWKALDELDSGVCDGLTYQEIQERYPEDFAARDEDKYNYRYRGGESYRDVVIRLEPIIMELERSENVIIVTHQAVLRCIYAYFLNMSQEQSPWMEVPLHTLIKLTPRAYGTEEHRIKANIPAVSTWRGKGSEAKHQTPGEAELASLLSSHSVVPMGNTSTPAAVCTVVDEKNGGTVTEPVTADPAPIEPTVIVSDTAIVVSSPDGTDTPREPLIPINGDPTTKA